MTRDNDKELSSSNEHINKRVNELEERATNVENRVERYRKRSTRIFWYVVGIVLIGVGVNSLVKSEDSLDIASGYIAIFLAGYFVVLFGHELEHKVDAWIINSWKKIVRVLRKRINKLQRK